MGGPRDEAAEPSIMEEKVINEEYKVWKKNAPFLYDLIVTHALVWPTLTIQWFPDIESPPGRNYNIQRILAGTHTSQGEQNFLQIISVHMPLEQPLRDKHAGSPEESDELGGLGHGECRINITHRINHDGEVNKARYMPQNPCIIATKGTCSDVLLFDYTKHSSIPSADGVCSPELRLKGHRSEGFGLAWSPIETGRLLSGSQDSLVCLWDVSANDSHRSIDPIATFSGSHTGSVEDIAWHSSDANIFVSVGDDCHVFGWDIRTPQQPVHRVERAHSADVTCVAWAPSSDRYFVTGSSDHTLALWDARSLAAPVHSFVGHRGEVVQVSWSPHYESVFASGAADRRVNVWDAARVGGEQSVEDAEDGPPELLFVHGGHISKISDVSWNLNEPLVISSAAEDNTIQVWQMCSEIYEDSGEDSEDIADDYVE